MAQYPKRHCKTSAINLLRLNTLRANKTAFLTPERYYKHPYNFFLVIPQDLTLETWTSSILAKWTGSETSLVKILFFLDLTLGTLKVTSDFELNPHCWVSFPSQLISLEEGET